MYVWDFRLVTPPWPPRAILFSIQQERGVVGGSYYCSTHHEDVESCRRCVGVEYRMKTNNDDDEHPSKPSCGTGPRDSCCVPVFTCLPITGTRNKSSYYGPYARQCCCRFTFFPVINLRGHRFNQNRHHATAAASSDRDKTAHNSLFVALAINNTVHHIK